MMSKKKQLNEPIENGRNEFHNYINGGDMEAVKRFVVSHPDVKCSYSFCNESELITALNTKNFDIFSYLVTQGFTYGENEDFKNILQSLTPREQKNLRKAYAKYFKEIQSPHIMELLLRSRLHFHSDERNFYKIQKFYEKLDKIPEIQPLLQVVANAENLDIVFDFNCASTCGLNPNRFSESTRGETNVKSGDILVGAKSKKKTYVLGVLAHELAHYAMQLMYENNARPYFQNDRNQREKYEQIIEEYTQMENHEHHINVAIWYQSMYLKIVELIVRVPHLIGLHIDEPKKLTKLRCRYKKLFEFYEINVLPDLRNEFPLMKSKQKIQELNKLLGVFKEFKASHFTCVESKLEIPGILDDENIFVSTEVPKLVFANLIKHLKQTSKKIGSSFIFIELEQLMDQYHGSKYHALINDAFDSKVNPKIFVLDSSKMLENATRIEKFFTERLSMTRIVLVSANKFESLEKFPIHKKIEHEWVDLEETSQNEILNWKIEFQGKNVELRKMLREEFFNQTSLKDIFKLEELKIDAPKNALKSSEICMDRTFLNKSGTTVVTCKEVLDNFKNDRVLVISDEAGMGKTTIARYFASELPKSFQSCWVVFVDLKEHTKSYFKDGEKKPPMVDFKFLIKLLKLKDDLELKIFKHFYETGNVIFILDGFDEISPKFKECLLKIVAIVKKSLNRLIITTRTHLSKDLEHHLKVEALKLNSLEEKDTLKLLSLLLRKRREDENDQGVEEFSDEAKASLLCYRFKRSLGYISPLYSPLLVTMISELDKEDLEDFNIYSLYERFVEKKIEIWNEKGPLAKNDGVKIIMNRTDIIQIHHEKALQLLLDDKILDSLKIKESEIDKEQITRIGLLYFDGENFQFAHRSFAEYFLAHFLILNLKHGTILNSSEKYNTVLLTVVQPLCFLVETLFVEVHLKENKNSFIGKFTVEFTIREAKDFICGSICKDSSNFLCVILANLKLSNEQKLELLENPDQCGEGPKNNVFHIWAKNPGTVETFFVLSDWAETFVSDEKLNEMFFVQKDFDGDTPFNIAMENDRIKKDFWESLLTRISGSLSNIDFKTLLLEKDKKGGIYLHRTSLELFQLIWNSDEVKLDERVRKNFLSEPGEKGFNFLMSALHRNKEKLVDCVLKEAKKIFSKQEFHEYLTSNSDENETCLQIAASSGNWKVIENLWNIFKESSDHSRMKSFLEEDLSGQKILLILAKMNRPKDKFIEDFSNFFQGLNLITNEDKETFLSRIQLENQEFNKHFNGIENILEHLSSGLSKEEVKEFLNIRLENGETCYHIAAKTANLDEFRLFWSFVKETFDEEEQEDIFYATFWSSAQFIFNWLENGDRLGFEEILNICLKYDPIVLRELSDAFANIKRYFFESNVN